MQLLPAAEGFVCLFAEGTCCFVGVIVLAEFLIVQIVLLIVAEHHLGDNPRDCCPRAGPSDFLCRDLDSSSSAPVKEDCQQGVASAVEAKEIKVFKDCAASSLPIVIVVPNIAFGVLYDAICKCLDSNGGSRQRCTDPNIVQLLFPEG